MAGILALLESWGYWGLLVASFVAGSVFPLSSEAVVTALQLAGLDPLRLLVFATVGNVAGSMLNYGLGRLGKLEWVERYAHVEREKVERTSRWMARYGTWMGVLCFLPFLGSVIAVTLGFMRVSPWRSLLAITVGKVARYAVLIYAVSLF